MFHDLSKGGRFRSGEIKPEAEIVGRLDRLVAAYAAARPKHLALPDDVLSELSLLETATLDPIEAAIAARLEALNNKDFAKADAIRNELSEQGISLMDYKDEQGQRATKWEMKR
ncbi:CysS/YqeB C-terminal domain-containing protein [Devosia ginsengisoli]